MCNTEPPPPPPPPAVAAVQVPLRVSAALKQRVAEHGKPLRLSVNAAGIVLIDRGLAAGPRSAPQAPVSASTGAVVLKLRMAPALKARIEAFGAGLGLSMNAAAIVLLDRGLAAALRAGGDDG